MVSNLYSSFNPAVLEAIQKVIDAAHDRGIPVSMCGEFAGDKKSNRIIIRNGSRYIQYECIISITS